MEEKLLVNRSSGLCVICNKLFESPVVNHSEYKHSVENDLKTAFSKCMRLPEEEASIVEKFPCLCSPCQSSIEEWHGSNRKIAELTLRVSQIQATLAAKVLHSEEQRNGQMSDIPLEVVITVTGENEGSTNNNGDTANVQQCFYDTETIKKLQRIRRIIFEQYSVSLHLEKVDEVTDDGGSERTGILDAHLTSESEGEAFGSDWAPEADCNEDDEDFRLEGSFTAVDERPKRKAKIKALSSVKKKRTARRSVVKVSADVDNGEDDKVSKEGQEEESGESNECEKPKIEKLRQVGPNTYMVGSFSMVEIEDGFQCSTCGIKTENRARMLRHVRRRHLYRRPGTRNMFRCVPVGPDKFIYANKYPICFKDEKYVCGQCGYKNPSKYEVLAHIRKSHFPEGSKKVRRRSKKNTSNASTDPTISELEAEVPEPMEEETTASLDDDPDETQNDEFLDEEDLNFDPPEYLEPKQKSTISTEIEPGKYAVGKFIFEKQGDIFKCMTCLRTADKKGTMIKHVRRHNNKDPNGRTVYRCYPAGSNKFTYATNFTVEFKDGKYMCPSCPSKSSSKLTICQHIRTKHIYGIEKYICELCGHEAKSRGSLRSHRKLHTDYNPGAHVCKECGKSFPRENYLKNHMLIHEGEKTFQCEYCGKKFLRACHFRSHIPLHTGERPFKCTHCPLTFATSTTMYYHRKTVHYGQRKKTPADRRREQLQKEAEQQAEFSSAPQAGHSNEDFLQLLPPYI